MVKRCIDRSSAMLAGIFRGMPKVPDRTAGKAFPETHPIIAKQVRGVLGPPMIGVSFAKGDPLFHCNIPGYPLLGHVSQNCHADTVPVQTGCPRIEYRLGIPVGFQIQEICHIDRNINAIFPPCAVEQLPYVLPGFYSHSQIFQNF